MKRKLLWRFRKQSEAEPFDIVQCGCKIYIPDGTVIHYCINHNAGRGECVTGDGVYADGEGKE